MSEKTAESGFLLLQLSCNQACNVLARHLYDGQPQSAAAAAAAIKNEFSTVTLAMDNFVNQICDVLLGKQGLPLLDFIKTRQNEICAASASLDEAALEVALARRLNAQSLMYENAAHQACGSKYVMQKGAGDALTLDSRVKQMCASYVLWQEEASSAPSIPAKANLGKECARLIEASVVRARELHLLDSKEEHVESPATLPVMGAALDYLPAYSFFGYCDSFAFDLNYIAHCMDAQRKSLAYKQKAHLFEARIAAHYLHMLHNTGKYRWRQRITPLINAISTLLLIKLLRLVPNFANPSLVPRFMARYIYRYIPLHLNDASAYNKRGTPPKVPPLLFAQDLRERWILQSFERCPTAWFNLIHTAFASKSRFAFYEPLDESFTRAEKHLKLAMEFAAKHKAGNESKAADLVRALITSKRLKTSLDSDLPLKQQQQTPKLDVVSVNVNLFYQQVKKRASMWAPDCIYECFEYLESKEGALVMSPLEDRTCISSLHPIITLLTMLEQIHPSNKTISWDSFVASYIKQQHSFLSLSGF